VEVWEGIDAIYLRKNNADYIKKEREKKKREAEKRKADSEAKAKQKRLEEEEKLQQQLPRFQQWQAAYQKVSSKIECSFGEEQIRIDKDYDEKKSLLIQQDEENNLRIQTLKSKISFLETEAEQRNAALKATSVFQFSTKKQLNARLREIDSEIETLSAALETARGEPKKRRIALEAEYNLKVAELKRRKESAYREATFPKCPSIVKKGAKILALSEGGSENKYGYICDKEADDAVQRFDIYITLSQYTSEDVRGILDVDLRLRRNIMAFVAANTGGVSTTEVYEGVAEANNYSFQKVSALLKKMQNEGQITAERKRGKTKYFPCLDT